jgi:putative membrane protein
MTYTLALLAQQRWDNHPMHGWDGGWMWLWGTLMMLTWAVIIAAAVWLVIRVNRRDGDRSDTTEARQILDERLARGEITLDEYRDRREAMR